MWHQVDSLAADLVNISKAHPEGIHLVGKIQCFFPRVFFFSKTKNEGIFINITKCDVIFIGYSQGGLVSRAILEKNPEHNVQTFISLSSPQAGQYGSKQYIFIFATLHLEILFQHIILQQSSSTCISQICG
jgi:hypothetical protein